MRVLLIFLVAILAVAYAKKENDIASAFDSAWNWVDDNVPKNFRPTWRSLNDAAREGWKKINIPQRDCDGDKKWKEL